MTPSLSIILHVDDDPNDLVLVKRAVQMADSGIRVVAASDGAEAIDYLSGKGVYGDRDRYPLPSLVLLDLKMPRRNGFEVLSWIRSQPTLKCSPVVILTSSKHRDDMERAYDKGANSYLIKPVTFDELVELVKGLVHYWGNLNQTGAT
jgi:CheY-like chemotaxis protein